MRHLISTIFRWITKYFISFVVILAVLVVGKWFSTQLQAAVAVRAQVAALQSARPDLGKALLSAAKQFERQMEQVAQGGFGGKVTQELDGLLAKKVAEKTTIKSRSSLIGLPTVADFQRLAVLEMEILALENVIGKARQLEWLVKDLSEGREQWLALSNAHKSLLKEFDSLSEQIQTIRANHPVASKMPGTTESRKVNQLIDSEKSVKAQADELRLRIENLKLAVEIKEKHLSNALRAFGVGNLDVDAALRASDEAIAAEIERYSKSIFWDIARGVEGAVGAQILTAVYILLGAIFVPIGIKLMFFYVIAPWASRRPPIQVIEQGRTVHPMVISHGSAASIEIEIKPDEEILIHSDHIQSSSINSNKTTKLFLNSGYPFTSIAAGLYLLTRIAPAAVEKVVVSSGRSLELKILVVDLPAGSAMVVQPRGLVGVIQQRTNPLRIESIWRAGHLHSWLTLQFRYLVFHGPAKLVVEGCRGVRMEPAGHGRLINQAATLGFSASAKYSVRRCETFISYWRGIEELFNDQFAGANCVYMYEEMPSLHRKGGITGRGLEGLTDSVLKVFGI